MMSPSKNSLPCAGDCACAVVANPSTDSATAGTIHDFIGALPWSFCCGPSDHTLSSDPFERGLRSHPVDRSGFRLFPGYLDRAAQEALLAALREVMRRAPVYTPRMPKSGKPMTVRMTNCGALGWITDMRGYRYEPTHPETGEPWPPIPPMLLEAWRELARYPHPPEACLVNVYGGDARMGLHQDRDEQDFAAPVVSLSLGDTCLFRIGGTKRSGPTRSLKLAS